MLSPLFVQCIVDQVGQIPSTSATIQPKFGAHRTRSDEEILPGPVCETSDAFGNLLSMTEDIFFEIPIRNLLPDLSCSRRQIADVPRPWGIKLRLVQPKVALHSVTSLRCSLPQCFLIRSLPLWSSPLLPNKLAHPILKLNLAHRKRKARTNAHRYRR